MTCEMGIKGIKIWNLLKAATGILCMVCFVANSFYIFEQFIGRKTITSQDVKKYKKLALPSVTVCNFSSFKKLMNEPDDIELQNYLNQTMNLEDVLKDVRVILKKEETNGPDDIEYQYYLNQTTDLEDFPSDLGMVPNDGGMNEDPCFRRKFTTTLQRVK